MDILRTFCVYFAYFFDVIPLLFKKTYTKIIFHINKGGLMNDWDLINFVFKNTRDGVFKISDLALWIKTEDESLSEQACYKRARRAVLKRLPVESMPGKYFRLLVNRTVEMGKEVEKAKKTEKSKRGEAKRIVSQSQVREILEYLNMKTGKRYKGKPSDISKINARMSPPESYTVDDFKRVIDNKYAEWFGTSMEQYLRPETLFGTKFESYLNQGEVVKGKAEAMARYDFEKYIKG